MRTKLAIIFILASAGILSAQTMPGSGDALQQPRPYIYREIDGKKLTAFVFMPLGRDIGKQTSAILLFHGGGWDSGSAEWVFEAARRFASLGMVSVAVDYRLSEGKTTPIEALDDTRAAFRWVRRKAAKFNVDPKRVAGYGVSAGGHLVAAAATLNLPGDGIDGVSSKPNLLLLWSPALDLAADGYFIKQLQGRAKASDYSPLAHIDASIPPICIVNGDKDYVTPLPRAELFRDRVVKAGGVCELHVYRGVGHLLTRKLSEQENTFDPDPKFRADGIAQHVRFLRERGYISGK
jgi:acetyl esterase/lipase